MHRTILSLGLLAVLTACHSAGSDTLLEPAATLQATLPAADLRSPAAATTPELSVGTPSMSPGVFIIDNPTAEELLASLPSADIFVYGNVVYEAGIDWVDDLKLTKAAEAGIIAKQVGKGEAFEELYANRLPAGTKLYRAAERNDVLLAKTKKGFKTYYAIVEG
ncbi:hypothetical protein [Gorillibacterium sp. sgz500922]|uniref:hypothetical protein n=1 Tax=Gorillibacterium sp. sgz500922 TaxID=3446694 RepID=UPI003F67A5B5